jgi:hypothetical protein
MSRRLTSAQKQHILQEMLKLARFLGNQGVPLPTIKDAVGQVRDDLVQAYKQDIVLEINTDAYGAQSQEKEGEHE